MKTHFKLFDALPSFATTAGILLTLVAMASRFHLRLHRTLWFRTTLHYGFVWTTHLRALIRMWAIRSAQQLLMRGITGMLGCTGTSPRSTYPAK